jgi:PAS domain S-box-containing protein
MGVMKDEYKTKKQLMDELAGLRRKLAEAEKLQAAPEHKDGWERQEHKKKGQTHPPMGEGDRARLLDKMQILLQLSEQVLHENTVKGLLDRVLEGARDLTGAKVGVSGHLHGERGFRITASSRSDERPPCPEGGTLAMERGGVYMEILEKGRPLCLKEEELKHHPAWQGLPKGHAPLRGLLGAPLRAGDGSVNGLIMLSDKESGDFNEEDAFFLGQLAVFASLALQHIEARAEMEKRALEAEDRRKVLEVVMENTPTGISVADFPSMRFRMMNRYGRELIGIPTGEEVEGRLIADVLKRIKIFEKDGITECAEEHAPLRRAMRLNETVSNRELVMVTPDGRELVLLCSARPVHDQSGQTTGGVLAWRDITSLRAAEKELDEYRRELERRVHERTADLLRMKQELELRMEEQEAVERTLRETNELLEKIFSTTNLCVAYLDTEFKFVRVNAAYAAADGRGPEFFTGKNHFDLYPQEDNRRIFQGVLKTGEPYIAHAKPFVYPEHPERGTTYWDWTLHPVRNEAGNIEGLLLCLIDVTERIRTQAQLTQSERELRSLSTKILETQEMERKIISKDIHDSIGSSLAAVKFRLEDLHTAMGRDPEADKGSLAETISVLKETIRDTRRICTDLRPSMLDNMGILATLRWIGREFGSAYKIGIEVDLGIQEEDIPERLKVILFRISQEALHNAAEHSKATSVHLRLFKKADLISLNIQDNGTGFDLREKLALKSPIGGMGLASMRERAALSGGSLNIVSREGKGTTIRASWPAPESAGGR